MIDSEISMKSLLFVTESLEQLIGLNGAKAVLRAAGQRAAVNLIEMLPLNLSETDAIQSIGPIMVDLGFISDMVMVAPNRLLVTGNQVIKELSALGLEGTVSGRHYVFGLFEGFFRQLTGSSRKVISVDVDDQGEWWNLG
jgi:hypothetical protein